MSVLGTVASLPQNALSLINGHTKSRNLANNTTGRSSLKAADTTTGTTTPSNAAQATTDVGSTFLNLLVKELQNQDPTNPMDSTAMVGQMISLNQLDQLIAINSALTPTTTSTTTTQGATPKPGLTSDLASGPTAAGSAATLAAKQALLASTNSSNPTAASSQFSSAASQLTAESTLAAAAARSASNAQTLNLTNLNSMFGGK